MALVATDPDMREITVEEAGVDGACVVQADLELMKGVLLNLMINAAQAMGRRGRINVSIAEGPGGCEISIADQGPGIPEEIREKVFDPFFTTKHRGTGLGLAVARRTVELHSGKLRFECPPGGGTVMIVSLPFSPRR